MSTSFDIDDDDPLRDPTLVEFENQLRVALEQRLLQAAESASEPTAREAAQLASMAAHMESADLARRTPQLRLVPDARAAAYEASALAQAQVMLRAGGASAGGAQVAASPQATTSKRGTRRSLLRTYAALAAVALGVAFVRGVATGPTATPATVPTLGSLGALDAPERASNAGAQPSANEAYLGGEADSAAHELVFEGRVTWDSRGQDGVVLVRVLERDSGYDRVFSEELVAGSEWTQRGALPQRFRVIVDRPADDGVSREELHCADYRLP